MKTNSPRRADTTPSTAVKPTSDRVDRGFDFPAFPNSWFQIAWSSDLPIGGVQQLRCLGRDLVLFRGEDGAARVLDAWCPHLGAHLGVGGSVEGNELRCPFHGWRFDGAGACTHIPHAERIPNKAKVDAWTVQERNGIVMLWHDADGRAPWFEIPDVPEFGTADWTRPTHLSYTIGTRWREIVENGVDRAHFHALHGYPEPPALEFSTDGPRFDMTSKVRWRRFGRDLDVLLDIEGHGAGFSITRGRGDAPFIVIGCAMPVDEDTTIHRMSVMVSRRLPLPVRAGLSWITRWSIQREFERDMPIWETKRSLARPVLCAADGPVMRFRKWARQFEPPGVTDAAVNGDAGVAVGDLSM